MLSCGHWENPGANGAVSTGRSARLGNTVQGLLACAAARPRDGAFAGRGYNSIPCLRSPLANETIPHEPNQQSAYTDITPLFTSCLQVNWCW